MEDLAVGHNIERVLTMTTVPQQGLV